MPQAVADLVDNSISAGANTVSIDIRFDGTKSWVRIADDGSGMDAATLTEALRYGTERDYGDEDLGKFGFGLKAASTSQCRRVVVASRIAPQRARIEVRALDLDHIERTNRWEILILDPADRSGHLVEPLQTTTGTVVLWENLDRVLDYKDPWGGWARRRLLDRAEAIAEHLGMVFHRFLAGKVPGHKLQILVNGSAVEPWDPFCLSEPATTALAERDFPVASENGVGIVHVRPYVLPDKADFSDTTAWQRASGPLKWNRQQGFYIYRANRLIQWGGWSRIRTTDEHSKLARVAIDFLPRLDSVFGINISKAIVKLPQDLRDDIEEVVNQVVRIASQRYRKGGGSKSSTSRPPGASSNWPVTEPPGSVLPVKGGNTDILSQPKAVASGNRPVTAEKHSSEIKQPSERLARSSIEAAARAAGELDALERIIACLRRADPEVARDLGW